MNKILPDKTMLLSHSVVGMSAFILCETDNSETVTSLWEKVKNTDIINTFDKYITCLVLLYTIGAIDLVDGVIRRNS